MYATALDEYLARHVREEVTDTMNRVCDKVGENDDAFLAAAGRRARLRLAARAFDRVEW